MVAEYTLRSKDFGTFRPSFAYSYAYSHITHVIDNPAQLSALNVVLFGRQGKIDLVRGTPRDKAVLTGNWSIWRFHNTLRFTRYGKYTEASTTPGADVQFSPKVVTDLDVGYDLTDNVNVALGAYKLVQRVPRQEGHSRAGWLGRVRQALRRSA